MVLEADIDKAWLHQLLSYHWLGKDAEKSYVYIYMAKSGKENQIELEYF